MFLRTLETRNETSLESGSRVYGYTSFGVAAGTPDACSEFPG